MKLEPALVDMEQELFELPQKVRKEYPFISAHSDRYTTQERVMYNKEVQTTDYQEEDGEHMTIEQVRSQIAKEYEAHHAQKERELEEESAKLDREIEEEIRGRPTPPTIDTLLMLPLRTH